MAEPALDEGEHTTKEIELSPEHIIQVATRFCGMQVLSPAVDLNLFTVLADGGLRAAEIERGMDLHPRATRDFLDMPLTLG